MELILPSLSNTKLSISEVDLSFAVKAIENTPPLSRITHKEQLTLFPMSLMFEDTTNTSITFESNDKIVKIEVFLFLKIKYLQNQDRCNYLAAIQMMKTLPNRVFYYQPPN